MTQSSLPTAATSSGSRINRYRIAALVVDSAMPIPGAPPEASEGRADVVVRISPTIPAVEAEPTGDGFSSVTAAGDVLLDIPDAGRLLIEGGHTITVAPADPDAPLDDLLVFLMGSAFGSLLMQRGLICLHATTVQVGPVAVALCGPSGAGKSTLGRALADQGHRLVADDVTPLATRSDGPPQCLPLISVVKLWEDAVEAMGLPTEGLGAIRPGIPKYRVPVAAGIVQRPVPLGAVLILEDGDSPTPAVTRLRGAEAALQGLLQVYRPHLADRLIGQETTFLALAQLAGAVPILRVARRKDAAALPTLASAIADIGRSLQG